MPTPSHRDAAVHDKLNHQFVPGQGYVRHDGPPVAVDMTAATPVLPPDDATDGSWHGLVPPHGDRRMAFRWVAREQAWERHGGARMAFGSDYLGALGWRYGGPVERG